MPMKWVAPNCRASASLSGFTSTATMVVAPAIRLPWMALRPMPPTPSTTALEPRSTLARFKAAPAPVRTAQPEQGGDLQGHVVVDADGLVLMDDGVLAEHAGLGEGVGRLALVGEGLAEPAQRRAAVGRSSPVALIAGPAVAEGMQDHVVSDGHLGDR